MNKKYIKVAFALLVFLWVVMPLTVYANSKIHSLYSSDYIRIEQMDGVSEEVLDEAKQTLYATQQYFRINFDISLRNSVLIVLASNQSTYCDEIITRFGHSPARAAELAKNTAGLAGRNIIIVNAGSSSTIEGRAYLIAHELTHIYQGQLAGNQSGSVMWILEGIANTVAAQVVDQLGYYRLENYKRNLERTLRITENKPPIGELIARYDWSSCLNEYGYYITYQTASYATLVLTERFGERRVMNYFVDLGQGVNSEMAFENNFGISIASFIGDYERILR